MSRVPMSPCAALYLRVSKARQAEHDVSIPDQRKQGESRCASRGYQLVDKRSKAKEPKPVEEVVTFAEPPLIDPELFEAVQARL